MSLNQVDLLKQEINSILDDANEKFKEIGNLQSELNSVNKQNPDLKYGDVSVNELNKSINLLTRFMQGAFKDLNNNLGDINKDIGKKVKKSKGE